MAVAMEPNGENERWRRRGRGDCKQHAESLRLMQQEVETLTVSRFGPGELVKEPSRRCGGTEQIKLVRLTECDNIEAYLTNFEHLMQVKDAEEATEALWLAPQLTSNSKCMRDSDVLDYGKVKAANFKHYNINEEMYNQRFRVTMRDDKESYFKLVVRLEDLEHK